MTNGLLWFDDDPHKRLEDKVLKAAAHYERKYGQRPDLCVVHPSTFAGRGNGNGNGAHARRAGSVEIRPGRSVLPDHLWLGLDEHHHDPAAIGG